VKETDTPIHGPAPQGPNLSSRGQRPRKRSPFIPFPLSPRAGRGVPKAGCGAWSGGFTPGYSIGPPPGSTGGTSTIAVAAESYFIARGKVDYGVD